jgi:ABC-type transport system involved in multi-copper enzyme maturation permease subunit
MNTVPVIYRELRAGARHQFTYWLRVIGAGAAMVMALSFVARDGLRATDGAELFQLLHATLQGAIWALVPLLAADCLSRERREGTLGLLFLTPLRAVDIVLAKSLAHGLRALTLLLAVLPVMALPLLMGGVSWQQATSSLCLHAGATTLAFAAGLLASALCRSWVRSLILAFCFAALFAFLFCHGLGAVFGFIHPNGTWTSQPFEDGFQVAMGDIPEVHRFRYYSQVGCIYTLPPPPAAAFGTVLFVSATMAAMSFGTFALIAGVAARLAARDRLERPPHPLGLWFRRRFCTPVLMRGLLHRWMRRSLDRNPIGWLERRTWSGRIVIWGWFAVLVSIYSIALTDNNFFAGSLHTAHLAMGWMLLGSMALSAVASFRRERETRVLELLLVSPLNERQIILGRLRGLWGKFLPSMACLLAGWSYLASVLSYFGTQIGPILFFAAGFVALPVIGLYFSLVCRNFLAALLGTVCAGMLLPGLLSWLFQDRFGTRSGWDEPDFSFVILLLYYGVIVAILAARLHCRLVERRFATESA